MGLVSKVGYTLIGAILLFGSVSPALAHTDVNSNFPKDGSTVEAGSIMVSVTFNDEVLDLADSSEIVVVDSNNRSLKVDCLKVDRKELQGLVFFDQPGAYRVTWRTVAEDGHPLTGKFSFEVVGSPSNDYVRPPCAPPEPSVKPVIPAEETTTNGGGKLDTTGFTLGALFVVTALSVVLYELVRRRKARPRV